MARSMLVVLLIVVVCSNAFVKNVLHGILSTMTCSSSMFRCNNSLCIPKAWRCDSEDDCGDMSDEMPPACQPSHSCDPSSFTCKGGKCISKQFVCDGDNDCPLGDDEDVNSCKGRECRPFEFRCNVGTCIPAWWVCDGTPDCQDGEDEKNCGSKCAKDEFMCDNGICIDAKFKCDAENDCGDYSDEKSCPPKPCSEDKFQCDNRQRCILKAKICDEIRDCIDNSDEEHCEKTPPPTCKEDEFQCTDNVTCIPRAWLCNGKNECTDGIDEKLDMCKNFTCRLDEFRCKDHKCIPGYLQCDGQTDCTDKSDEDSCASPEPTCKEDEFKCGDNMCIPNSKTCDKKADCPNGEDEPGEKCFLNECNTGNGGCNQLCIDTPTGYRCGCRTGYKLIDNFTCDDINECEDISSCSQICINEKGTFKCECEKGYLKDPHNHRKCRATEGEASLIFSRRYDIRLLNIVHSHMKLLINSTKSSIALDFHYKSKTVFWSDGMERKIYKTKLYSNSPPIPVIDSDLTLCDGLAIDWIYEHIYWSDTGRDTIMVSNFDGKMKKTLITSGLDKPRAIALNPIEGWMFWSDWGKEPRIERAGLDGSNRLTIATYDVQWPNGLALDLIKRRLYWIDAKLDMIFSVDYDGSRRKIVLQKSDYLAHPFSITLFEDNMFWTDWFNKGIYKANKFDGSNITSVTGEGTVHAPMVVHVFHPYKQPDGTNYCKRSKCAYLCLPAPNIGPDSLKTSCVCPDGQVCNMLENQQGGSGGSNHDESSESQQKSSSGGKVEQLVSAPRTDVALIVGTTIAILAMSTLVGIAVYYAYRQYLPNSIIPITIRNPLYKRHEEDHIAITKNELLHRSTDSLSGD